MGHGIHIRPVHPDEVERLRALSIRTFMETFAALNSEADMRSYVQERLSTERLMAELRDTGSSFFFAQVDDELAGYLKLNRGAAQTDARPGNTVEVERIYVLEEFQGRRIGQALFAHAVAIAEGAQATELWLGVWEQNSKAIAFYERNGFVHFGQHVFQLGADAQTDLLMRLPLAGTGPQ